MASLLCEHGVLSNRQVFSSNVEYNFEWMVPLVNLIHITPLEKPVRARHHGTARAKGTRHQ